MALGIIPMGEFVALRLCKPEDKTVSAIPGFTIPVDKRFEDMDTGIVIEIGEWAFEDYKIRPEIGDKVAIDRYQGKLIYDTEDRDVVYRIVAAHNIWCIVKESK